MLCCLWSNFCPLFFAELPKRLWWNYSFRILVPCLQAYIGHGKKIFFVTFKPFSCGIASVFRITILLHHPNTAPVLMKGHSLSHLSGILSEFMLPLIITSHHVPKVKQTSPKSLCFIVLHCKTFVVNTYFVISFSYIVDCLLLVYFAFISLSCSLFMVLLFIVRHFGQPQLCLNVLYKH